MNQHPSEGGSYIRQSDGSLKREDEPGAEPAAAADTPGGKPGGKAGDKSKQKSKE